MRLTFSLYFARLRKLIFIDSATSRLQLFWNFIQKNLSLPTRITSQFMLHLIYKLVLWELRIIKLYLCLRFFILEVSLFFSFFIYRNFYFYFFLDFTLNSFLFSHFDWLFFQVLFYFLLMFAHCWQLANLNVSTNL